MEGKEAVAEFQPVGRSRETEVLASTRFVLYPGRGDGLGGKGMGYVGGADVGQQVSELSLALGGLIGDLGRSASSLPEDSQELLRRLAIRPLDSTSAVDVDNGDVRGLR
jgi:hypothetical protein